MERTDPILILSIGLVAGWVVNLVIDSVPRRRAPWMVWFWPLGHLPDPVGRVVLHRLGRSADAGWHPHAPWRATIVWMLAIGLGWLSFRQTGWHPDGLIRALYAWFFLAVAAIDIEHRLVLNRMLLPALPVMGLGSLLFNVPGISSALLGGACGFGLFFLLALLWPGAMGMGDVKLAGVIGLVTGLPGILVALVVCIVAGGLAGLIVLMRHRFRRGQTLAYAPYLVLGAWVALYFGRDLWNLYLQTL